MRLQVSLVFILQAGAARGFKSLPKFRKNSYFGSVISEFFLLS